MAAGYLAELGGKTKTITSYRIHHALAEILNHCPAIQPYRKDAQTQNA